MGKRELVALVTLSSWCLVMVKRLFLAVPWGCLRFVIVVFSDHTHLLFLIYIYIGIQYESFQVKSQRSTLTFGTLVKWIHISSEKRVSILVSCFNVRQSGC